MSTAPTMTVLDTLQRQIANTLALYLNYKRYHWYATGPHFRELHLLFDDHATEILATFDELGERVRILGGEPIATLSAIQETITVLAPAAHEHSVRTMLDEAIANHRRVIAEMREGAQIADRAGDPGTVDLFSRFVQIHEKQEWFLRELASSTPEGRLE